MKPEELNQIFTDTEYIRWSGTKEERQAAEYLKAKCEELGIKAEIEEFKVSAAEITSCELLADGNPVKCNPFWCCGSGEVEGELYYMPSFSKIALANVKDKIVLLDTQGVGKFNYADLVDAGAKAILFQYGDIHYDNDDIDFRDLRKHVVEDKEKLLCAMIHTRSAIELVKNNVKTVKLSISQEEKEVTSQNIIAEIKGRSDRWIVLSAHYDSVMTSKGAYDNMSGCASLLYIADKLKNEELNYGLRFVFCGSEERGLLGSKAYVNAHEDELKNIDLNINVDMVGSIMGKFISVATAEEGLASYINYLGAEVNFPVEARCGVYSSDSTPFADKGVPALSFARITTGNAARIHCRYDTKDILSMKQLAEDGEFMALFTKRMANCVVCPVSKEIPEKIKKELDEYLFRKRK